MNVIYVKPYSIDEHVSPSIQTHVAVSRLISAGWVKRKGKGDHTVFTNPKTGHAVTIPVKQKDIGRILFRRIMRQYPDELNPIFPEWVDDSQKDDEEKPEEQKQTKRSTGDQKKKKK